MPPLMPLASTCTRKTPGQHWQWSEAHWYPLSMEAPARWWPYSHQHFLLPTCQPKGRVHHEKPRRRCHNLLGLQNDVVWWSCSQAGVVQQGRFWPEVLPDVPQCEEPTTQARPRPRRSIHSAIEILWLAAGPGWRACGQLPEDGSQAWHMFQTRFCHIAGSHRHLLLQACPFVECPVAWSSSAKANFTILPWLDAWGAARYCTHCTFPYIGSHICLHGHLQLLGNIFPKVPVSQSMESQPCPFLVHQEEGGEVQEGQQVLLLRKWIFGSFSNC